jgi:uncharacterized damage-inducible protein DinB
MISSTLIDAYLDGATGLRRGVAGMSREQLISRPIAGKWSTLEVVCHLVDSDQAWIHRMKRVIAEDRPLLIGYDESRFAASLAYHERDLDEELGLFEQGRCQMSRILRSLSAAAAARVGVHSERGLVTLEEMIQVEIDHVHHHLRFVDEKRRALQSAVSR